MHPIPDPSSSKAPPTLVAPLFRRLSAAFYDAALSFGIFFVPAYFFLAITQSKGVLEGGRLWTFQGYIFIVFGVYFGWSWAQGRRTLPQKTWGLRILQRNGQPLSQWQAVARYTLAWASLLCGFLGFFYALIDKDRSFLHDRILGTHIVLDETGAAYGISTPPSSVKQ